MQDSECFRTRLLLYSILFFSSLSILKSNLKTWTQLLSLRVCLTLPLPPHKLPIHVPQPWPHLVYLFADSPKDERFPICYVSFQISSHAWGVLSLPLLEVWNSFFSKRGNACIQHILMSVLQYQAWFCSCWLWKKKEPPLSQNAIFLGFSFNFVLLWLPSHVFSFVGMTSESYVIASKHSLLAKGSL